MNKKTMEYPAVFTGGGLIYGMLELLFRGRTHWSMLIAGGVCSALIYAVNAHFRIPLHRKWLLGGVMITTVEFIAGCIVNIRLGWQVWDYSAHPFHIMGQICPAFFALWYLLSIPAVWLCGKVRTLMERVCA